MNAHLILRVLATTVKATNEAGEIIRNILKKGNLKVVEKTAFDYQTEADRQSQRLICNALKNEFPTIKIVGEEDIPDSKVVLNYEIKSKVHKDILNMKCPSHLQDIPLSELVIWVDPLDGTSEFTEGHLEHVTVLVGIGYKGKAIGGALCQPFYKRVLQLTGDQDLSKDNISLANEHGRIIWALEGLGVYGLEKRTLPKDKFIICTTNSHRSAIVSEAINALNPSQVIHVGGCGMKVLMVIEGVAHAYIYASKGSKKWDTCAPEAILNANHGHLTDACGNAIDYSYSSAPQNKPDHEVITDANSPWVHNYLGIVATHESVNHADIIAKIPQHIKDKLIVERNAILENKP